MKISVVTRRACLAQLELGISHFVRQILHPRSYERTNGHIGKKCNGTNIYERILEILTSDDGSFVIVGVKGRRKGILINTRILYVVALPLRVNVSNFPQGDEDQS